MRMRNLNLIRYGHFTDFSLDFEKHANSGSDFHIIFGENEAGKSTAINGFFELLFGINNKTEYGFKHGYENLCIGAILEFDDKFHKFLRIKGRKDTLLNAEGHPIPEDILTSALHGHSEVSYQQMFCLNEEILEKGGEEILSSKGDVGRLLFTGTAGLADLSKLLETLQDQANKIYKEGRSQSEISSLKQQLEQLEDKRKKLDIQVTTYRLLSTSLQKAEESYKYTRKTLDDIKRDSSNLYSLKKAFPFRIELLKLEKELEVFADLPDLPLGWIEEVIRLQQERDTAQKDREETQDNINSANHKLALLKIDPIINMREDFKAVEFLKVRFEAADEELPQIRSDLRDIETDLEEIRQKLGVDKLDGSLVIPVDTINCLENLLQEEILLKQSLHNAEQELAIAKDSLKQALREKEAFSTPNKKVLELEALFNSYNYKEDPQLRVNNARKTLYQKNRNIDEELKSLAPWRGTKQEIKSLEFPTSAQADNWSEKAKNLKQKLDDLKRDQKRHKSDLALCAATLNSQSGYSTGISDASANNSRGERENAWTVHRKRLDATSADEFEKALDNDDNIRDQRLAAVDQLSRLRAEEEKLAKITATLEIIADEIREIEEGLVALRNEMRPALSNAKLPDEFEAESLRDWLKDLQRVRKLVEEEDECCSEINQAENECTQQRKVLLQALKKAGAEISESLGLEELRVITKTYLERASEERRRHDSLVKTLSTTENEESRRNKVFEIASSQLQEWEYKWNHELEKCWLKGKTIGQVRALLGLFKNLASKLADQKKSSQKIREKEADQEKFFTSASKLFHSLGLNESVDKMVQFLNLQLQLTEAQELESERISAQKGLEESIKQYEKADKILCSIKLRVQEMASYFSIPEDEDFFDRLGVVLKQAHKKNEIVNSIFEKELILFQYLGVESRPEADEKFAGIIFSDVDKKLTEIEGTLQVAEKEFEYQIEERKAARQNIEKIGGDACIALLNEERQSILLEISKKANRALALHLGLMAADHALTTYRDRHRSEFLMQTTEAFKAITGGAFSNLTTQSNQAADRLIAIRSNGQSIATDAMSKGTRYQLYLALRLAAYRRFCNETKSLPFIGDDIMETFDDSRSEAAIRQLSKIAKHGQVLYFTHHRHLCDIAKRVCGNDVVIHEIPKQDQAGTAGKIPLKDCTDYEIL
jgi:uncharacterized protein YhaN